MMMNDTASEKSIGKRAQILFKALVERYIREGQPVGSKTLAVDVGVPLSPATIRNVLADLEEQGLLQSPHTSAGRIPTAKGYRLFVDSLLTMQTISPNDVHKVKQELNPKMDTNKLIATASSLLSKITSLAGLVTIPKQRHLVLTQVEFLPLSANRILVVLVINGREVQNRIIHTHRIFSPSELQQASNYLNAHFAGKELAHLKRALKNEMQQDKQEINQLLKTAIESTGTSYNDFVMSGEAHLLEFADISNMGRLKELFSAFTQKNDIMHLLNQCLQTEGVQLFIGEESHYKPLDDFSLVTSPYTVDGQVVGALAVIGPTRMAYDRIIPIVDITAKLLSAALNQDK